jgi:hypothetical protein
MTNTTTRTICGVSWTDQDDRNLLYLAARRGDGMLSKALTGSVRNSEGAPLHLPTGYVSLDLLMDYGWVSGGPFGSLTRDDIHGWTWDAWQEGREIVFTFRLRDNPYKRSPAVSMSSKEYHALFHGYDCVPVAFLHRLIQLGYSVNDVILGDTGEGDAPPSPSHTECVNC